MRSTRSISRFFGRERSFTRFDRRLASISGGGAQRRRDLGIDGAVVADSNRMGFDRKDGILRHLRGFLADSDSDSSYYRSMASRPNAESRYLRKKNSFFSTVAGDIASKKPAGEIGKQKQNEMVKNGSADEEIADVKILRSLMKYLWLKDNFEFRMRVVLALGLLIGAKVINVQVPFLFKLAVDWLSAITSSSNAGASFHEVDPALLALFVSPAAVLVGYGVARVGASACNELQNAVFSKVAARAIRTVSKKVFSHLHGLDLGYHLSRQTGALNRIIDRGSRAINFILQAMVFHVLPTILEITMVSGILAYSFGASFACITSLSVATYVAFTLVITQWRTKFRQAMNKADNDASSRAIDSLLNYETVKYFNNESYEVAKYDVHLKSKLLKLPKFSICCCKSWRYYGFRCLVIYMW